MKRILKGVLPSLMVSMMGVSHLSAQVEKTWEKQLESPLVWQKVFSSGNYLTCTNTELASVNPETGKNNWILPQFEELPIGHFEELEGTSLLSINAHDNIYLLDPFSGEIKFDAKASGIKELSRKKMMVRSNNIFLAGKNDADAPILLMVNLSDGKILWKLEEEFGSVISVNEISADEMLLVTIFNNYKIKVNDGAIVWKNSISEESAKLDQMGGALGAFVKDIANNVADQSNIKVNYYEHPLGEQFVIGIEQEEERETPDGKKTIVYSNVYHAFQMDNGTRLWSSPVEMKGKMSECAFIDNNFIVMPDDGSSTKINMFDLKTGAAKWGKKARGTKVKGGVVNHFVAEDKIIVVSNLRNKNMMYLINAENGAPAFKKPIKIAGKVQRTIKTDNGLLYITNYELNVLNPVDGSLLFENSISTSPALCIQKGDELFVFDTKEQQVKTINLKSGAVQLISKAPIQADGKEAFNKIELREKGVLLTSDQNIALVSYEGETVFNKYYPAPKQSNLKQALLYAQAARAMYIGAKAYSASAQLQQAASKTTNQQGSEFLSEVGDAYADYGTQASDFAFKSLAQAKERFKASSQGRDFVIILADTEDGNALLKVDKNTGEVLGDVNLGKEKEPKYTVDDVTGQIFKLGNKSRISSYKL